MCRLKLYSVSQKCVWRFVITTACILLTLGATSFGFGMKLMEFAEKPDITPIFVGIPMTVAGFLGLTAGLCKKGWLITCYAIMCVIIGMLSIHMNYKFMGKELPSIPMYRNQCLNEPRNQYHCDKYLGTVILCSTAVLMLPSIITALLSCFAAKRTLKKKNCYLLWFTCGKVEPMMQSSYRKAQYKHRHNNEPVGLLRYKKTSSKGFVCEIPETRPAAEYVPRIPDFTDLAGRLDSPGYPASVIFEFETEDTHVYVDGVDANKKQKSRVTHVRDKNDGISNDVKLRKENPDPSRYNQSGLPQEDDVRIGKRHKKENSSYRGLETSEVDLSLLEQDYLNRRSYLYEDDSGKYYDLAAEEWIHKIVDNFHDSRSRLYGVSDEEDLDDDPKRKTSSDVEEINDVNRKTSTTITSPPPSSEDVEGFIDAHRKISRESESGNKGFSNTITSPPPTSADVEGIIDAHRKISRESESEITGFSTTITSPPRQQVSEVDTRKISGGEKPTLFSRKRKFGASSPSDIEQDEPRYDINTINNPTIDNQSGASDNNSEEIPNEMAEDCVVHSNAITYQKEVSETKDLTPHGIVTPAGQSYPTGSLCFDFEKAAPTEHARKNWVEFDGEAENREKLLKGKMTLKEYEELTSYLM